MNVFAVTALQEPVLNWLLESSPSIGVIVVLLLATWHLATKFNNYEHRFVRIDSRFEQIDSRFEQIDSRFEQIDLRFTKIDSDIADLKRDMKEVQGDVKELRGEVKEIKGQLRILVSLLKGKNLVTQTELKSNSPTET